MASWEKAKIALQDYYAKLKKKQSLLLPFFNKEDHFAEAIRERVAEIKAKKQALKAKFAGKKEE